MGAYCSSWNGFFGDGTLKSANAGTLDLTIGLEFFCFLLFCLFFVLLARRCLLIVFLYYIYFGSGAQGLCFFFFFYSGSMILFISDP